MSRCVASRRVVSCHVMSCHVTSSFLVSRSVALRYLASRRASCHFLSRHALSRLASCVMSFLVTPWRRLAGLRSPDIAWCEGPAREEAPEQKQRASAKRSAGAKGRVRLLSYRFYNLETSATGSPGTIWYIYIKKSFPYSPTTRFRLLKP